MTAFEELLSYVRDTEALGQISERLSWDQETVMPRGAVPQRAEEMGALEKILHARRTSPELGALLEKTEAEDAFGAAVLRHVKKSYARDTRVPADLAAALAKTTSLSQGVWAEARANEDFLHFAPMFKEVIALRREEAAALTDGDPYDALLNDYEPGATGDELSAMFGAMRPRLVALRDKILGQEAPKGLNGTFEEGKQIALSREIAKAYGYDLAHGRIDKAVHPFSSGSGLDVRITTRTDEADPFNCLYSTIHEVGHACYEQNIDRSYLLTPLGNGVSMGVHESQSRIYENQIGRSRGFTEYLYGRMRDVFGEFGIANAEDFYAAVNAVSAGYIRTEADEVNYNLHVLLRFDLEREIISGALEVDDLPDAWDARFKADFGVKVDKISNGCLQDVHWPVGLFGYFPTYSLGNLYAGCLFEAMNAELSGLQEDFAKGDLSRATNWLKENLQVHGGLREPRDTIKHACGKEPSELPLLNYIEQKFNEIYP